MRYGGATVVVVGKVEEEVGGVNKASTSVLRAIETGQRFHLSARSMNGGSVALPVGELLRVTGRVTRGSEGNENEIWLDLERVVPFDPAR